MYASLIYHSIFDYPLTPHELKKWRVGKKVRVKSPVTVQSKNGFYFLKGNEGVVSKRIAREKISKEKFKIAHRAGNVLVKIPTVKMVGITGALAMKNADKNSDIDLMIITTKGILWTTRLLTVFWLMITGFKLRRFGDKNEKDRLCLNMWLDESDLIIKKRNIFTAHEIAQIIPIVNKNKTYEKLLYQNKWILDYWPKAVRIKNKTGDARIHYSSFVIQFFELIAFNLQYLYMRSKITKEVVTPTRTFFHPFDWSKRVLEKF